MSESDSPVREESVIEPSGPHDYGGLRSSVGWGYVLGFLLMLFIFLILIPDADGPSPWDAEAFQSSVLEFFANFRILDELADLSVVKVADVGEGLLKVDLDLICDPDSPDLEKWLSDRDDQDDQCIL